MRKLKVIANEDPLTPETFLVSHLCAVNEPFLPRLKSFECNSVTEAIIPFISLFLSPTTTEITIAFDEDLSTAAVALIITMLPTLCPKLEDITIRKIKRDPVITDAVSRMVLTCNPDSLQVFQVDSPLTEEAREVVYRLPKLSKLWTVIEGHTMLPQLALPNLTDVDIEYDDHLDWLQEFHGAALENLQSITFHCESEQIGDFLGAFERFALATSAQNTLLEFGFYTSRSWNPNYSSLLPFQQLKAIEIEFSCDDGCSSRVDDNTIIDLAQSMPKLEVLQLGGTPCTTSTGATVHGLIALAFRCLRLSELRIHFRGDSLVDAVASAAITLPLTDEPVVLREECALTNLEVGWISIPAQSATKVALMLLRIFPRILDVKYANPGWEGVVENIKDYRRICAFVRHAGMVHSETFNNT